MQCPACDHPNVDGARYCAKCGALLPPPRVDGQDPLIGTILGGRFRVTGLLGEGGMGRVYTAEQPMGTSIRKVAVKTLLTEFSNDPTVVQRFMRECGTVVELEHPNTIKFHDFGRTDSGELYIAMEFVDGQALADVVALGALAPQRVDNIMKQICGSLHEAHTKGVIHRDLKPENVILTNRAGETDFVKVLDFGIAKRSEASDQAKEQKLTQAGMVLGTPPYMSPEQFMGKELDSRSDIYSLGVMAYEMLTGKLPFEANTPWEWATQHMTAQPSPFEQASPMAGQIPPSMKQAIMRALSKDKEQRQETAKQFYSELSGTSAATGELRVAGAAAGGTAATQAFAGPAGATAPGRAGATQIGEPFAPPGGGPVPGPMAGAPAPAVPAPTTGGGQAYPAPPPTARSQGGGNKGLLIGLAALVGIGLIVGIVFAVKGGGEETEDSPISVNTSTSTATATEAATSPPETTEPTDAQDAGGASTDTSTTPTSTTPAKPTGPSAVSGTAACDQAISAAMSKNCSAARAAMSKCSGAKQSTAAANISKYCSPRRRF